MTALNFPSAKEIRLQTPPLAEVLCQVKFNPILRISKDTPIDFQEAIRQQFPSLIVEQGVFLQFTGAAASEKPPMDTAPRIYRFRTPDELSHIALAMDFFALSTKHYTHWDNFNSDLDLGYKAIQKIYKLPYATRVGLRYINRFDKTNTGCADLGQILDLFRPELTCLIRADVWQEPREFLSQVVLDDDQAKLAIRIALGKENDELFVILDLDYFEEGQVSLENISEKLNHYHNRIYDAFRWCILDTSLVHFQSTKEV
jgi:uncharacterized protein (TIGR04255 family)